MIRENRKLNILEKKSQVFSSKELQEKLGSRMAISRLVEDNKLISLGSGFYSTIDLDPPTALFLVVSKFFPKAVISGLSALVFHGLSDEVLDKVNVDIPKTDLIRNHIIKARRVAKGRLIGVERRAYYKHLIKIYDVERSLCDAFRVDRGAIFFKALKRYLSKHQPNIEQIARYDKALGTKVLRAIQQELADE